MDSLAVYNDYIHSFFFYIWAFPLKSLTASINKTSYCLMVKCAQAVYMSPYILSRICITNNIVGTDVTAIFPILEML